MYSVLVCLLYSIVVAFASAEKECRDNPLLKKECAMMKESFGEKICKTKYFSISKMMKTECKKTCGFCSPNGRALAPTLPCDRSRYGCCWDTITTAQDTAGSNCPPCSDRHSALCGMFQWMCKKKRPNADYIKMNCPVTCGLCSGTHGKNGPSIFDFYVSSMKKIYRHKKHHKQ